MRETLVRTQETEQDNAQGFRRKSSGKFLDFFFDKEEWS